MITTEIEDSRKVLIPRRQEDLPRSPGLHLGQIINSLANEGGVDNYGYGNGPSNGSPFRPNLRMECGFLWEDILTMALKARLPQRIGEIVVDGIAMSPDGVDDSVWELWEYKATWVSSNRNPADNWRWMTQIMGYMWGLQMTVCNMWILYVNGDYKGSGPVDKQYRLEFTCRELEENWVMITNHARLKGWIA